MAKAPPHREATQARQLALEVLVEVEERDAFAKPILNARFERHALSAQDRALATELVYGTLRHAADVDTALLRFLREPLSKLPAQVRQAMRLGAYQLLYLRTPVHSAVDQAVSLVPRSFGKLTGLTNAVLRKVAAYAQTEPAPTQQLSSDGTQTLLSSAVASCTTPQQLAAQGAHPEFFVKELWEALGPAETQALVAAQNERPPLSLRVNTTQTTPEAMCAALLERGLLAERSPWLPEGLLLPPAGDITLLPGFAEGHFYVQDMAAALVGHLCAPRPTDVILDACAAPGGKTTHLAELQNNQGKILAVDRHPHRIGTLARTCDRLKHSSVVPTLGDACDIGRMQALLAEYGCSDGVPLAVLDAPCSGLGTLRRHPELRQRAHEDQGELQALQARLLRAVARMIKPGGHLVYAVCTPLQAEGPDQVHAFLDEFHDFFPVPIAKVAPKLTALSPDGFALATWPHRHGLDAFWAIRLERRPRETTQSLHAPGSPR